ncbi:hypothetical protein ACWDUL_21170 [Nocardia niigatensis]
MTSDIDSRTVGFDEIDAYADQTADMRSMWSQSRRAAESTAADLREAARKLTALRRLPLKPVANPDPAEWYEDPGIPEFPLPIEAVDHMFGTLICVLESMATRYTDHAHALTRSLAELDVYDIPADLRGSLDHAAPEPATVNSVLDQLRDRSGVQILCVWDVFDEKFGGSPHFVIESRDRATLCHLAGDLWGWLTASAADPDAPTTPGHPTTWIGPVVTEFTPNDLEADDGHHNYALRNSH